MANSWVRQIGRMQRPMCLVERETFGRRAGMMTILAKTSLRSSGYYPSTLVDTL